MRQVRERKLREQGNDMAKTKSEQHLAFKKKATEVLAAEADRRRWCTEFDDILEETGLGHPLWHYDDSDAYRRSGEVDMDDVVGEPTAKAFEAWKLATVGRLHAEASEHGIVGYEDVLREAGFDPEAGKPREVTAVVKGTFEIEQVVTVADGQDLVEALDTYAIAHAVYQSVYSGRDTSTWKATIKGSGTSTTR